MATQQQALETFNHVRAFCKDGSKASNKSYYGTGPTTSHHLKRFQIKTEEGAELNDHQKARNTQVLKNAEAMKKKYRAAVQKTPYDAGAIIYGAKNRLGNCGEMTYVAVYLAISVVHVPDNEVWLRTLKYEEFEHTFAVLGYPQDRERWVVDAWANVCCTLADYPAKLKERLNDWNTKGKRIAVSTLTHEAWVPPTDESITSILGPKGQNREEAARG